MMGIVCEISTAGYIIFSIVLEKNMLTAKLTPPITEIVNPIPNSNIVALKCSKISEYQLFSIEMTTLDGAGTI